MTLQFASLALLAAVADIRRLVQFGALCRLKVRADFKASGLITGVTGLSISEFTGIAQIAVMLAISADHARIVPSGLFQFDVCTDFLGNGCGIFS